MALEPLSHREASDWNDVPQFDCLFLDFTSVLSAAVANAASLEDTDLSEYVTEVFAHLDRLVVLTQPSPLVYIAIDGAAPRAKHQKKPAPPSDSDDESLPRPSKHRESKGKGKSKTTVENDDDTPQKKGKEKPHGGDRCDGAGEQRKKPAKWRYIGIPDDDDDVEFNSTRQNRRLQEKEKQRAF
jgi:hypothetical protein